MKKILIALLIVLALFGASCTAVSNSTDMVVVVTQTYAIDQQLDYLKDKYGPYIEDEYILLELANIQALVSNTLKGTVTFEELDTAYNRSLTLYTRCVDEYNLQKENMTPDQITEISEFNDKLLVLNSNFIKLMESEDNANMLSIVKIIMNVSTYSLDAYQMYKDLK